ncbi:retrotransposon protein, putative, ty1-copia subclass [Tanacetum coccineum]
MGTILSVLPERCAQESSHKGRRRTKRRHRVTKHEQGYPMNEAKGESSILVKACHERDPRGFLSQKRNGMGRGVKEKNLNNALNNEAVNDGVVPFDTVAFGINNDTQDENLRQSSIVPTASASRPAGNGADVAIPLESIRVVSERYELVKSMLNSSTGLFFFEFSSMDDLDSMLENGLWFIRNNLFILKKWNPDVNFIKEDVGNVPVWVKLHGVPMTAFSEDGFSVIATKLSTPLMLDSYTSDMCIQSWGRSSYARALIEIRADMTCACCKVFGHDLDDCPKNIDADVTKNLKKPSQAPRGVSISPNVGFKPAKQVYRPVSKKTNASTSGNKKKDVDPTKEVSNSYPFDVLYSIENDVGLGTNGGTSNMASKWDNSSGSSFYNVNLTVLEEIESFDNEMKSFLASEKVGYGTNSLLEQWKKTYENDDYGYDPYDDDMYESQNFFNKIQSTCDNLDIKVRDREDNSMKGAIRYWKPLESRGSLGRSWKFLKALDASTYERM